MKCITNRYFRLGRGHALRSWNISRCSTTGGAATPRSGTAPRHKPGTTTTRTLPPRQPDQQEKHYRLFKKLDTAHNDHVCDLVPGDEIGQEWDECVRLGLVPLVTSDIEGEPI